jgi:hypothetical protein
MRKSHARHRLEGVAIVVCLVAVLVLMSLLDGEGVPHALAEVRGQVDRTSSGELIASVWKKVPEVVDAHAVAFFTDYIHRTPVRWKLLGRTVVGWETEHRVSPSLSNQERQNGGDLGRDGAALVAVINAATGHSGSKVTLIASQQWAYGRRAVSHTTNVFILLGIAASLLVAAGLTARLAHARVRHLRSRRRAGTGKCRHCGYPTTELASDCCPECGYSVS